jgi:DNA-binding NarL/FixJ family response regulator
MPRLSGGELAERVWAEQPDLPVSFTSGYTQEFRPESIPAHRRAAFLQKPYGPEQLVGAVLDLTG